jgi:hypothetical protein
MTAMTAGVALGNGSKSQSLNLRRNGALWDRGASYGFSSMPAILTRGRLCSKNELADRSTNRFRQCGQEMDTAIATSSGNHFRSTAFSVKEVLQPAASARVARIGCCGLPVIQAAQLTTCLDRKAGQGFTFDD